MPLPHRSDATTYARKATELALRTLAVAPEFRVARRLRSQARPPHSQATAAQRVLMLCPRNWVEHVQNQAMLAHALRLHGADVRFATCGGGLGICDRANVYEAPPMPCRSCSQYTRRALDAHGFTHADLLGGAAVDAAAAWPELDEMTIAELGRVEYAGLELGRLVDIPVKWFLCAADVDDDPLVGPITRSFLRSARQIVDGLNRLFDTQSPDTVVMLSGLFLFEILALELCRQRDIDAVTYERAFLKDTLVFSRDQPAGWYDFSEMWRSAQRRLTTTEDAELDTYLASRRKGGAFDQHWNFASSDLGTQTGRLAVLFTNLTWDTAVIDRDRAFSGIRAWIDACISAFADRPLDRLVIRIHPSEVHLPGKRTRDPLGTYIEQQWPELPSNVVVVSADDSTSSYDLMAAADFGLVYTSTTGLELALSGTPVLVAGETHYREKGFTIDASDPEEFRKWITALADDPTSFSTDVELARQYAHFFFFRAPFSTPGVVEPLPGLARITVSDLAELEPGVDQDLDRLCSAILDRTSFAP